MNRRRVRVSGQDLPARTVRHVAKAFDVPVWLLTDDLTRWERVQRKLSRLPVLRWWWR